MKYLKINLAAASLTIGATIGCSPSPENLERSRVVEMVPFVGPSGQEEVQATGYALGAGSPLGRELFARYTEVVKAQQPQSDSVATTAASDEAAPRAKDNLETTASWPLLGDLLTVNEPAADAWIFEQQVMAGLWPLELMGTARAAPPTPDAPDFDQFEKGSEKSTADADPGVSAAIRGH